mmetsp:Transcript_140772/g.392386  ORF Transcript_140772/g.392386 Transcript_140772/m.392386 type:complete len:207 (-) Transcript_140772:783-1403(-)
MVAAVLSCDSAVLSPLASSAKRTLLAALPAGDAPGETRGRSPGTAGLTWSRAACAKRACWAGSGALCMAEGAGPVYTVGATAGKVAMGIGTCMPFAARIISMMLASGASRVRPAGMPESSAQKRSSLRGSSRRRSHWLRDSRGRGDPGRTWCSRFTRYCCWLPCTVPGRMSRAQPMKLRAAKPRFCMAYTPMTVAVRPRPERQWTA